MIDLAAGVPICGFIGPNGAGKTLLAAESAIADMARGREVYSTVPIVSRYGNSKPIVSLRQLLELRDTTILLDEVAVIFSSRSTGSLPPEIVALLQTLRHKGKEGNTVRWTAPSWMRPDVLLREVTQGLVNVHPHFKVRVGNSPWPRPRLLLAGLMDTQGGKVDDTPTKVLRRRIVRPSSLAAWGAYDSHADTPLLGGHLHSGVCVDCGGSRTRPKHDQARHELLGLPWFSDEDDMAMQRELAELKRTGPDLYDVELDELALVGSHSPSESRAHEEARNLAEVVSAGAADQVEIAGAGVDEFSGIPLKRDRASVRSKVR